MDDYRLQALRAMLQKEQSSFDIKEGGGMIPGVLDEQAAARQEEYLHLLTVTFENIPNGRLDQVETQKTLMGLIEIFQNETDELVEACERVGGFDDVKQAWTSQNEAICRALEHAVTYYEHQDHALLESALDEIKEAMAQRLPLYHSMSSASKTDLDNLEEGGYDDDDDEEEPW